jgi:UDP-3-O-[3-hydroxymyristoyl] glucosamine N-acyltransferase
MLEFTANQIAQFLNGKVVGNGDVKLYTVAKIEEGQPGALSFLANPKYINYIYTTGSSAVLVNSSFQPEKPVNSTLIYVEDAYQAFASLLDMVADVLVPKKSGIEQPVFIDATAKYGTDVYIGAFAYIGKNVKLGNNVKIYPQVYVGDNVVIGDNTIINPGVKIYFNCELGKNVTIHAGSVIGADGFGFAPSSANNYKKIPQIGNVISRIMSKLAPTVPSTALPWDRL